jgi:hypothetical protein
VVIIVDENTKEIEENNREFCLKKLFIYLLYKRDVIRRKVSSGYQTFGLAT